MMSQTFSQRCAVFRTACPTSRARPVARRASLNVVALGSINDPEKTKQQKDKKKEDSEWAEPKNDNPVEKKTILRGDPGKASEGDNALENVGKTISDAVDKVTKPGKEASK